MSDEPFRRSSGNSSGNSHASFSSLKRGTTAAIPQFFFNFEAAKASVQKTFDASATAQFRRFFAMPLFDRLVRACIQHFLARFEHDLLLKASALERATLQRLVGVAREAVRARLAELATEAESALDAAAPAYAAALLRCSAPRQPHQDALFWGSLSEAVIGMVAEAFPKRPLADMEVAVGELLCTPAFNLYGRRHRLPRPVDALSLEQLCALKGGNAATFSGSARARLLASLHDKPDCINVQVACQANSCLVTRFIASPEVARSAGLSAALAERQAAARRGQAPFQLPNGMLDAVTAGTVNIDRAGMISDAAIAELAQLRRVLAGKEPILEGLTRGASNMSMYSALRAGSVLRAGSMLGQGRSAQVAVLA